jgi:hypothetical protein
MTPAMVGIADGLLRLEGPADAEAAGDHDGEAPAVEIDQASFPEPVVVPIGPPSAGRALVAARQPMSIWPEFSPIITVANARGDRVVAESSIPAAISRKKRQARRRQGNRAVRSDAGGNVAVERAEPAGLTCRVPAMASWRPRGARTAG